MLTRNALDRRSLKPLSRKVLALAAASKAHEKDKEHLRVNLCRAEEEVSLKSLWNLFYLVY